jgi:hypothetical protein
VGWHGSLSVCRSSEQPSLLLSLTTDALVRHVESSRARHRDGTSFLERRSVATRAGHEDTRGVRSLRGSRRTRQTSNAVISRLRSPPFTVGESVASCASAAVSTGSACMRFRISSLPLLRGTDEVHAECVERIEPVSAAVRRSTWRRWRRAAGSMSGLMATRVLWP